MDSSPEQSESSTASRATALLKAAGGLVVKRAERTKLVTITLPRAYGELGKAVHKEDRLRQQFAELFQNLDALLAERQKIADQATARPTAETLAEKAKRATSDAAALAKSKAIDVQAFQAFVKLGEAVYQRLGEAAGPAQLVGPVVQAISRRDQLDQEVAAINEKSKGRWVTPKRIVLGAGIVIGLALVARFFDDGVHPDSAANRTRSAASTETSQASPPAEPDSAAKKSDAVASTGGGQKSPPSRSKGSAAYEALVRKAKTNGYRVMNDMDSILAEYGTVVSQGHFRKKNAVLFLKSTEEEDVVLLIAEVEPLAPDHNCFGNDYVLRSFLKALTWETGGLVIKGVSKAEGEPLTYGVGSDGKRFLKTEQNGDTTFSAVVLVGEKACEIAWPADSRMFPKLNGSLTIVTCDGKRFTSDDGASGAKPDMRKSTIEVIRSLLSGGKK